MTGSGILHVDVPQHDHRRASYDDLLVADAVDSDNDPVDEQGLLGRRSGEFSEDYVAVPVQPIIRRKPETSKRRAFFIRSLALLCACFLSVGSHYASYILGPLKSRLSRELGASHTEFSLLFSAFSLNSTWTPLIGGVLASSLGTTFASILATGIILSGQVLLLLGEMWGNIRLMAFGLFVFGLGVSPLAVVQETIIVRFFKSHGLGVSMALGLVAGKGASFISARTSYPLTEHFGSRAPFYVATLLAGVSFLVNLCYIMASRWLVDGAGAELEATDISEEARRRSIHNMTEAQALEKVAAKKRVNLRNVTKLGDVFWAYVLLNVFCGAIWAPFTHLASNIIEIRYKLTEQGAANNASYLLAGSIFLYPICGYLVDRYKRGPIVVQLLLLSSTLTLLAFTWLALPPTWTGTPIPAIASFAFGHGFSPLLLVVLVPKIVSLKYVSTALGVHKSLEQTGSVLLQTLAGRVLDQHRKEEPTSPGNTKGNEASVQRILVIFLILNVIQLLTILGLTYLQHRKDSAVEATNHEQTSSLSPHREVLSGEQEPLLETSGTHRRYSSTGSRLRFAIKDEAKLKQEIRRGEVFASCSLGLIVFAWVLFMGTAYLRLGTKQGHA